MKASIFISLGLAAVAAGVIVFWDHRADSMSSSATVIAVTHPTATLSDRVDMMTDATEESVDSDSDQLERSAAAEAIDRRRADSQQDMADAIYRLSGTRVVQRLTDSGLAPSDSEEIARRYAADLAACAMAALTIEAARQSISVDELLSHLAAAAGDGGDPYDAIDRSSLEANALPCEADAMQRAGIAFPSDVRISYEEGERLRECFDQTIRNSDLSSRDAILELCAQNVFGGGPPR